MRADQTPRTQICQRALISIRMDLLVGFPRAETDVHVVRQGFPPFSAINKKYQK